MLQSNLLQEYDTYVPTTTQSNNYNYLGVKIIIPKSKGKVKCVVCCYQCGGIRCVRRLVAWILMLSGTVRYRRTALDFQSPSTLMSSMGTPAWKAKEAPPTPKRMGAKVHSFETTFFEAGTELGHGQTVCEGLKMEGGVNFSSVQFHIILNSTTYNLLNNYTDN